MNLQRKEKEKEKINTNDATRNDSEQFPPWRKWNSFKIIRILVWKSLAMNFFIDGYVILEIHKMELYLLSLLLKIVKK